MFDYNIDDNKFQYLYNLVQCHSFGIYKFDMIYLLIGKDHNCSLFIEKGKLPERVGRKAVSLNPLIYGQGSQVAVTIYKLDGSVNFAPPLSA